MVGLPGDYTPPSRLVRAAAFSQAAVKLPTATETVPQVFHIMNVFDIPLGSIQEKVDDAIHFDFTQWTTVTDLKNLRFAYRTYKDQSIHSIDVRKALAAAGNEIKVIEMDSKQPIENVSTKFK